LSWSNYAFSVTFNNSDNDGVGVLFRYQNPSNFYKVDLDSRRNFHKLFKMAGGVETTLAAESGGYVIASNYVLRVEVTNSAITVLLNGMVLFGGTITDNSLQTGTVALYSWGSQGVRFSNLNVAPLQRWPRVTIQSPAQDSAYYQVDSIPIALNVLSPDFPVQTVKLFNGTSLLTAFAGAPWTFQWTNLPPPGSYTLTAQVVDNTGQIGVSSPVGFTVALPLPTPVILGQPANQSVHSGSSAVFQVLAGGPQPYSYQWQFNNGTISGATNIFLLLNNVQISNAGNYTIAVANPWGSTTSQIATLSVNTAPQPSGNTNRPPWVYFPGLQVPDPGLPLVTVSATNVTTVRIDWSSNFQSWTPLLTLTNYGDPLYFADPDAIHRPYRFYRAVAQQ
jgi:hypothetical protein